MKPQGFLAVLCMVLYTFDVCASKCKEYIIVFQELTCGKIYTLKPIKIGEIVWSRQTYPYNTSAVHDEVQGYKDCALEFTCMGKETSCFDITVPTNHSTHHVIATNSTMNRYTGITVHLDAPKINITKSKEPKKTLAKEEESPKVDVNIIYINKNDIQNNSEFIEKRNYNKNKVACDYAETVCIYGTPSVNNILGHKETGMNKTLTITLTRDFNSTIQPFFTGYFPQAHENLNTTKKDFIDLKTGTLLCEIFREKDCKQNNSDSKFTKQINVYVKANYIKNNTRTIYPNCTNDLNTKNKVSYLECDSKNFTQNNPHILLDPPVKNSTVNISNHRTSEEVFLMGVKDLLICKCHINYLNNTEINNSSNITSFKNCSNYRNIINITNPKYHDVKLIEDYKNRTIDSITTTSVPTELSKTEISIKNTKINKEELASSVYEDSVVIIRITENGNNCSQNSEFSIHEGKIIDLDAIHSKKTILEHNNVVLNISNCINFTSPIANNTNTQTELDIVLKNSSLNTFDIELFDNNLKETALKQKLILKCDQPNLSGDLNRNKTILQCQSIYLEDFHNTTEHATPDPKETIIIAPDKSNRTANETHDYYKDTNKTKEKDIDAVNILQSTENTFNRKRYMLKGSGQKIQERLNSEPERILLIVIASIAGTCIILVLVLQRFFKKEYTPAPTREAPEEEDTPL